MRKLLTLSGAALLLWCSPISAQTPLGTEDFGKLSKTWSEVGDVKLNPTSNTYEIVDGEGILLNLPEKKKGEDIRTENEYGDMDLSLEYMMFPGSNSGIYLQGRYEVQLLDSWRRMNASSGDNGGIYKRFSEEENREMDGHPPRQNASKAPGLWQKMEISFRAPRFDASGQKIENAKILQVVLNGVQIHQDVELFAPTGGGWGPEAPTGPLRIQGDHGAVAFRNITINTFENPEPVLRDITYKVYEGMFSEMPDFDELTPVATGELEVLSPNVSPTGNGYLVHYAGTLEVATAGNYQFMGQFNGGGGTVVVDGTTVIGITEWGGQGETALTAGNHQVDVYYAKFYEWAPAGLRFMISGPGIRNVSFHDENMNLMTSVDPIYLEGPTMLRSFMDIPGGHRVTRAVSVASREGVHYTYDMDHGSIVHAWRGEFIDATPMWNSRGDGSSRPRGAVTPIDGITLVVGDSESAGSDTVGTSFRPRGYVMDGEMPRFQYDIKGHRVTDEINVLPDASGFSRRIAIANNDGSLLVRLGSGREVEKVEDGLYRIDGQFYVRVAGDASPEIRADGEQQSVWMEVKDELNYEIIF